MDSGKLMSFDASLQQAAVVVRFVPPASARPKVI
jgi:hypothetical protein